MKLLSLSTLLLLVSILPNKIFGQKLEVKNGKTENYTYQYIKNDPFKAHRYTLKNGMTVILAKNNKEPRIQTYIAVKAGSKTDPKNNTGLAHYLEHLLFKGTENYGTTGYMQEKPHLDMIDQLYRDYNTTKDENKRAAIYHKIDSISGIAAKYAIANEYDKMMQKIGAIGTNAFTSFEQTVYVNNIPSNNLDKWLAIEGERFQKPVFRIFHTELEAVFEEKNISLDNDDSKVFEAITAGLFKKHPYGTQTTIGTVEHLKNPSLDKIREYFDNYYRPNNMALIMVGEFDEANTISLVDKYFSSLEPKNIPPFGFEKETAGGTTPPITITGPSAEFSSVGYRFDGVGTRDAALLKLTSQLIYNGKGGLLDKDLIKAQKVSSINVYSEILKDYSYMVVKVKPKTGESVESIAPLINVEMQKLVTGNFEDDLIDAVIENMKVDLIKRQESSEATADMLLDAYTTDFSWEKYLAEFEEIKKFRKKDVMDFAARTLSFAPVVVYKKQGDVTNINKVVKPEITPVDVEANRDSRSAFAKKIELKTSEKVSPKFINYHKEINISEIKKGLTLYHVKNQKNELYQLNFVWDMGKENIKLLPYAVNYLKYLGTSKHTNDQFNTELYKLATDLYIYAGDKSVTISLSGLRTNMEKAVSLVEDLLTNVVLDATKYREYQLLTFKNRKDDMLNKGVILRAALRNYALFGLRNPFSYNITNDEATRTQPDELVKLIKSLKTYKHKIYYYGPGDSKKFIKTFNKIYHTEKSLVEYPEATKFIPMIATKPTVLFVDYNMVQAEILWAKNEQTYNSEKAAIANLFQEYYGGGMGSIVFQTIRESKALAYSCNMRFNTPDQKDKPYVVSAYVGTQSDKLMESVVAMNELLDKMPLSEDLITSCKSTIKSQIETERFEGMDIIYNYEMLNKLGIDKDLREYIYNNIQTYSSKDLNLFFDEYIKSGIYTLCIVGSKKNIDLEKLKAFGVVRELSLKEIFGY